MTDFAKNIIAMVLTVAFTNGVTIARFGADIENINKTVSRIENKLEKIEERVLLLEIQQARYLAAN